MSSAFFSWRAAVLASGLKSTTRHVLLTLACHMNGAGESCFPSVRLLAGETGLSRQTVIEHLKAARLAGWIAVKPHGSSGHSWRRHEYKITWPAGINAGGRMVVNHNDHKEVSQDDLNVVNTEDLSISEVNSSKTLPADHALAHRMFEDLVKLHPGHRNPDFDAWAREIRLMRLQDGHSHEQILSLWALVDADKFWRKNILSPKDLRKNWDKLIIRLRPSAGRAAPGSAQPKTPIGPERCAEPGCNSIGKYRVLNARYCAEHFGAANDRALGE